MNAKQLMEKDEDARIFASIKAGANEGKGDSMTDTYRECTMSSIQHHLAAVVHFLKDLERRGWRNEEERKALTAMTPSLVDMYKKVDKMERTYHQAHALKHAHDNKPMTNAERFVCEVLLAEKLPANAFFEYVIDPDSRPPQVLTFAIPDKRIGIGIWEIPTDRAEQKKCDEMSARYGWTTLRFSNSEILNEPEAVRRTIRKVIGHGKVQ